MNGEYDLRHHRNQNKGEEKPYTFGQGLSMAGALKDISELK